MARATQRIPVPVTAREKKQIAKMAKDASISMGEYMRRAAAAFRASEDERVLGGMIDQMPKTTERANQAIDRAVQFVEASNRRIARIEAKKKVL